MEPMKKIVLLKHGTGLGNEGDTVSVTPAVFEAATRKRQIFDGCKHIDYRVARPAEEKVPEVTADTATAAEMAAAGKRNVVATPVDDADLEALTAPPASEGKKGKK